MQSIIFQLHLVGKKVPVVIIYQGYVQEHAKINFVCFIRENNRIRIYCSMIGIILTYGHVMYINYTVLSMTAAF